MLKTKVGYSNIIDAYEAGVETAKKVSAGINAKVGLLFNTVSYDQKKLIEGIKSIIPEIDIIGCATGSGIITTEGYFTNETGITGMFALEDEDLMVACYGMAKKKSARETGREVALKAIRKANIDYAPDYFFMSTSPGEEEEYIKGIQDIIGRVPCFGGSAADSTLKGNCALFYNNEVFKEGIVVAFFYTRKDITTVYTGAYRESNDMGIITKLNGVRVLAEIDGVPATDKYKQWRELDEESMADTNLLLTTIDSPLGIKDRLGNLTAIRHPLVGNSDKSMNIGANVATGTAVIRMEATIDELIDSTENSLKELKEKCPNARGYLLIHSDARRLKIGNRMNEVYERIKRQVKDIPFLVIFTSVEYGYGEDQYNTIGNLMLSFSAFEEQKEKKGLASY